MKRLAVAALMFLAACASQDEAMPPPRAAPDPAMAQLQVSMTELLERIDVLNHRIARLEETRAEAAVSAPVPQLQRPVEPQRVAPPAQAAPQVRRPAAVPAADETQPALVAARIAEEYREAIMLFGRGSYGDARRRFEGVFEADPAGDLADNALFWIGETYFATGDHSNAVRYYNRVVNEYADQNKAPDALFKTGLVQVKSGDLALARRTLQQVVERYPYSSTAGAAKAELQRIRF
jgi:tol-pal system protein YbgF